MTRLAAAGPGPPRVFAILVTPTDQILVGTTARGLVCSNDGQSWACPVNQPGDGTINSLAVIPAGGLLAAMQCSGLHRSDDDGLTWEPIAADLATSSLYGLLAQPDGSILVGTAGRGVLRSRDEGRTWTQIEGLENTTVYRVIADGPDDLLAATEDVGCWRIRGARAEPAGLAGASIHALLRLADGTVIAGTSGQGIWRRESDGSWAETEHPREASVVHALATDSAETVYAGCGAGVVRSYDGGRSWQRASRGLNDRRMFAVAVTSTGAVLAGSYDGVWRSDDRGEQWVPCDTGLTGSDTFAVTIAPSGEVMSAGGNGVWSSADVGETWSPVGAGLAPYSAYGFCWLHSGDVLVATDDGVYRQTARAGDWSQTGLADQRAYVIAQPAPHVVLAGMLGAGLHRSDDDGHTWSACPDVGDPLIFDIRITAWGDVLVATGNPGDGAKTGGVFRSGADAECWERLATPPVSVYGLAEDQEGRIYAAAQRCIVLRSEDRGDTWTEFAAPGSGTDKSYAIAVAAGGRIFLGTDSGAFCSEDRAETWVECIDGLAGATPYGLSAHPDGTLLAATTRGVLRWTDTQTWH
jgi:photosystem II stability/assembly factor-like uncharacterized protein